MKRSELRHQGSEVCKKCGWGPLGLSLVIREEARSSTEFLKSQPSAFSHILLHLPSHTYSEEKSSKSCSSNDE